MGSDWSLLGGNPAPGDTGSITPASTSLRNVATAVDEIVRVFDQRTSGVGPDRWSGDAASAFHTRAQALPPHLHKAHESFGQAADALARYATQLGEDQTEAAALLTAARAAADAERTASAAADHHRTAVGHLVAKQAQVDANLAQLAVWKRAAVLSGDIAAVQNYVGQEAVQRSEGRAVSDATQFERTALRRADAAVASAASGLQDARRRADAIRERQSAAGNALRDALQAAHEAGLNPKILGRLAHWLDDHGPALLQDLSDGLSIASGACALIGLVFPPFLAVAGVLSLAAGAAGLGAHIWKFAEGKYPKGNKGRAEFGIDVAEDAVSLLPGVKYLGEGEKLLKVAATAEKVTPAANLLLDAGRTELEHPGANQELVWTVVQDSAGFGVTKGISFATHQSPPVRRALRSMAKQYATSEHGQAKPLVVSLLLAKDTKTHYRLPTVTQRHIADGIDEAVKLAHEAREHVTSGLELGRDFEDNVVDAGR